MKELIEKYGFNAVYTTVMAEDLTIEEVMDYEYFESKIRILLELE